VSSTCEHNLRSGLLINFFLLAFGKTNATREIYFTNSTNPTSHDEYGYGNGIMV